MEGVAGGEQVGVTSMGSVGWTTQFFTYACSLSGRLLCFEPGLGDALPAFGSQGEIVFVSSEKGTGNLSTWPSAGGLTGLAAADHVCQTLAANAGYASPSAFVAWQSTSDSAAFDRLGITGPWRRPGGVRVVATKAGLLSLDRYHNALMSDIESDDLGVHDAGYVFTGTGTDGQPTGFDCAGWTSASPTDLATRGTRQSAAGSWTDALTTSCDQQLQLYCFYGSRKIFVDDFESGGDTAWDAAAP